MASNIRFFELLIVMNMIALNLFYGQADSERLKYRRVANRIPQGPTSSAIANIKGAAGSIRATGSIREAGSIRETSSIRPAGAISSVRTTPEKTHVHKTAKPGRKSTTLVSKIRRTAGMERSASRSPSASRMTSASCSPKPCRSCKNDKDCGPRKCCLLTRHGHRVCKEHSSGKCPKTTTTSTTAKPSNSTPLQTSPSPTEPWSTTTTTTTTPFTSSPTTPVGNPLSLTTTTTTAPPPPAATTDAGASTPTDGQTPPPPASSTEVVAAAAAMPPALVVAPPPPDPCGGLCGTSHCCLPRPSSGSQYACFPRREEFGGDCGVNI